MAYDKEKLFNTSKEIIPKHNLIFIDDVVAMLGVSSSTFYAKFPAKSEEMEELKKLIEENKIKLKVSLRKKWLESDNATLQMALYKLSSTKEEHKKLQQNHIDHTTNDKEITHITREIVEAKDTDA